MSEWDKTFFAAHRQALAQALGGGLIVLKGFYRMQRRNDMAYPFVQEPNFWYLTGIAKPGWSMIYDGAHDKCWLVRPEVSESEALFEGTLDDEMALTISGANEIVPEKDLESLLRQLARRHGAVYTLAEPTGERGMVMNPSIQANHRLLERLFQRVIDCSSELAILRSIKSPDEIRKITQAIQITTKAFAEVCQRIQDYSYEYEIEAEFDRLFKKSRASHAYDPIVASGSNACTLHYTDNNARLKKNAPILIDIGAEIDGYCADITRTYQYGAFKPRAKAVHDCLAAAQREIIAIIKPNMPVEDYQRQVDAIMRRQLVDLKLLNDENDTRYRHYFPHAVSHGLGIDVHDSLGKTRTLRPGMVLTVEPGIYIPEEAIGMRIEDVIVIEHKGVRNLSKSLSTDY